MIKFILFIFLVINPITDFNDIAKVNTLKKEAREAYNNGDFETAINKYTVLMQEYQESDPNMMLNLSHSFYNSGNMEEAEKAYKPLIASADMKVRSIANQQLGNMASAKEDYETALNYYKAALKAAPDNEEARYNYELTKKLLDEQKKQEEGEDGEEQQEEQDQNEEGEEQEKKEEEGSESEEENQEKGEEENEEQSEAEKQEGEAENETEQENQDPEQQEQNEEDQRMEDLQSLKEKLEELNMNEETAMMILEALKNQEVQYIQQQRRKSNQPKKSGKPDW